MSDKILDMNKFIRKKNLESLLAVDYLELYQTKGSQFVINVLEYIINSLKETEK